MKSIVKAEAPATEQGSAGYTFTLRYAGEPCGRVTNTRTGAVLPLRSDLRKHSASFSWGYGGSGPAQLSLAILADYLGPRTDAGDAEALALYQGFKGMWTARLPLDSGWTLSEEQLAEFVGRQRAARQTTWRVADVGGYAAGANTPDEVVDRGELLWTGEAVSYDHALALARAANPRITKSLTVRRT